MSWLRCGVKQIIVFNPDLLSSIYSVRPVIKATAGHPHVPQNDELYAKWQPPQLNGEGENLKFIEIVDILILEFVCSF